MMVTKSHLTDSIHTSLGLSKRQASGKNVLISGFGKFPVLEKGPGNGINPQTGEALVLDVRRIVTFRDSSLLREKMNTKPKR